MDKDTQNLNEYFFPEEKAKLLTVEEVVKSPEKKAKRRIVREPVVRKKVKGNNPWGL